MAISHAVRYPETVWHEMHACESRTGVARKKVHVVHSKSHFLSYREEGARGNSGPGYMSLDAERIVLPSGGANFTFAFAFVKLCVRSGNVADEDRSQLKQWLKQGDAALSLVSLTVGRPPTHA